MDKRLENPQGNRGSDILYLFKMKAERPEKYREEVNVIGANVAVQRWDKLTELAARSAQRRRLDEGAAEGDYLELQRMDRG